MSIAFFGGFVNRKLHTGAEREWAKSVVMGRKRLAHPFLGP